MQLSLAFPVVLIVGGLILLALLWRFTDLRKRTSQLDELASTLDRVRDRVTGGEEISPGTAHRLRAALTSLSEALRKSSAGPVLGPGAHAPKGGGLKPRPPLL